MGRHRQPTKVLQMRGTFKKNPQRLKERANEPQSVEGTPTPPAHLDRTGKAAYRRVVKHLKALNCLSTTDEGMIELYAATYSQWRKAEKTSEFVALVNTCSKCLVQMGLTPSARSTLKVNTPKESQGVRSRKLG